MTHLRTRNEIMKWLEEHAPRPAIARAMQEGSTELLGVFRHVLPYGKMGWIVNVTSKHGSVWHVGIHAHEHMQGYWCHVTSQVFWEHWMGDVGEGQNKQLCRGDNPDKYREMKNAKTKK